MYRKIIFTLALIFSSIQLTLEVHLSQLSLIRVARSLDEEFLSRVRRQVITDPQMFPVPNAVLNVPLPTNIGHFPGSSKPVDKCNRDEILMEDGTCQNLLTNGNCGPQEEVLLDPETNKGFCAPRLCPPDRVFVHSTQLCHDPQQMGICPLGRELYYSAHGTSVCSCPDGTVEGDDDLDDDVCEPLLGESLQCLAGQVFWFKDFNSPPECLPDPCHGANLKRGPNDLPFVPSKYTGECHQLGASKGVCPDGLYYALKLEDLRGECETLEDAGYNIYDPKELEALKKIFGATVIENNAPPIAGSINTTSSSSTAGSVATQQSVPQVSGGIGHLPSQAAISTGTAQAPIGSSQHIDLTNQLTKVVPAIAVSSGNLNKIQDQINGHQIKDNVIQHNGQQLKPFSSSQGSSISHQSNQNVGQTAQSHQNVGHPQPIQNTQPVSHNVVIGPGGITSQAGNFDQNTVPINNINVRPITQVENNRGEGQLHQVNNLGQQTTHHHNVIPQTSVGHIQQHIPFNGGQNQQQVSSSGNNQQVPFQGGQPQQQVSSFGSNQQIHLPGGQNQQQVSSFGNNQQFPAVSGHHQQQISSTGNQQQRPHIGIQNQQSFSNNQQIPFGGGQQQVQHHQPPIQGFHQGFNQNIQHQPNNQGLQPQSISIETFGPQGPNQTQQPVSLEISGPGGQLNSPEIFNPGGGGISPLPLDMLNKNRQFAARFSRSLGFQSPPIPGNLAAYVTVLPSGNVIVHALAGLRKIRSIIDQNYYYDWFSNSDKVNYDVEYSDSTKIISRKKRNLISYASPSNVFETRLLGCRPGAARDINAKCRNTILPSRIPKSRGTRAAPPVPPTPTCPRGMAFNIRRKCVASTTAQNSLLAFNLG